MDRGQILESHLSRFVRLGGEDAEAAACLPMAIRRMEAGSSLVRPGRLSPSCLLLVEGCAIRHRTTMGGERQITSVHLPGDALNLQELFACWTEETVETLTAASVAAFPSCAVRALIRERPAIAEAAFRSIARELAICREWLVNNGRRDAATRLAHLLCEFAVRVDGLPMAVQGRYMLPVTQDQIADVLSLTPIHVNRMFRRLETEGFVRRTERSVLIADMTALRRRAGFDPRYLEIDLA